MTTASVTTMRNSMPILTTYRALEMIALNEFADIVVHAQIMALPTCQNSQQAINHTI